MDEGASVTVVIDLSRLPLLPGVEKLAAQKHFRTRASKTNAEYVASGLKVEGKVDPVRLEVFHDAQTSGGLLISVAADRVEPLIAALQRRNAAAAAVIGEVRPRGDCALLLRP